MRARLTITSIALLAACGQSDKEQPLEAANYPDSGEDGLDLQNGFPEADNASAENGASPQ